MIYIPLIVDAAITPLVFVFANTKKDNPTVRDDYPGLLLIFLAFFATTATIALAINGSVRLLIFSKKKLLHHLDNYIAGKPIPKRITKTKIFVAFLHGAKTIKRHPFTRQ
ncbi:MAG: hypothetical protein JST13_10675 [Bacteroidetes bacterium]|nr:hypothetical protein [Bacteroidota bacterium]